MDLVARPGVLSLADAEQEPTRSGVDRAQVLAERESERRPRGSRACDDCAIVAARTASVGVVEDEHVLTAVNVEVAGLDADAKRPARCAMGIKACVALDDGDAVESGCRLFGMPSDAPGEDALVVGERPLFEYLRATRRERPFGLRLLQSPPEQVRPEQAHPEDRGQSDPGRAHRS